MSSIKITKKLILPGTRGKELWIYGDSYARTTGADMVGVQFFCEETDEDGPSGSGVERNHSVRVVSLFMRRSADNGQTWRRDPEPFWELTPTIEDAPYGYVKKAIDGFVLDVRKNALVRFTSGVMSYGPAYYGFWSPTYRQGRVFYEVSHDGGRTWTKPRQVVNEGVRVIETGEKYYWMDWAPGVKWGQNAGYVYTGSTLPLEDGSLLTGFYRWGRNGELPDECCALRMRWKDSAADTLVFECGQFLALSPDISAKGVSEPCFVRFDDGQLFVTLRLSGNQKTGIFARRYYALSSDQGRTWGPLHELTYDDGASINVPESMSHVIRSSKTGKIYWIGNINDQPVWECYPRHRLAIAELHPQKLSLVRDTVTIIDESPLGEKEMKYSNYVLYEDRFSKDLVVVMTELAAVGEKKAPWHVSNGYRYEINVGA